MPERPATTKGLQAAAAVGQCELMFLYDKLFSEYGVVVSQLLFTSDELNHEESKKHLVDTFNQLLEYDCLPIVNENDSISVEELLNGDNDCLSARVAEITASDLLILLTDTDGLYDSNPFVVAGLSGNLSFPVPTPIAPEDTSITSCPSFFKSERTDASFAILAIFVFPVLCVNVDVPTLTTILFLSFFTNIESTPII